MDDTPGASIVFEGPVATYQNDNEEDEEELERRQQEREVLAIESAAGWIHLNSKLCFCIFKIQERLQGGELDGILGEEDFQYSSEDEEGEETTADSMIMASNAVRRSSINKSTVQLQPGDTGLKNNYYPIDGIFKNYL